MHYDRTAFTKNGLPTIENIYDGSVEFGNAEKRLSQKDIIEINALYDCISSKLHKVESGSEWQNGNFTVMKLAGQARLRAETSVTFGFWISVELGFRNIGF